MPDRPLYVILELHADATPGEIKQSFRRLALKHHPDKAGPDGAEKFQQLIAAYTVLRDPETRKMYDKYGEQGLSSMDSVPVMAEAARYMDRISFIRLMLGMSTLISAASISLLAGLSVKLDLRDAEPWPGVFSPGYALLTVAVLAVAISIGFRIMKYRKWYKTNFGATEVDDLEMGECQDEAPGLPKVISTLGFAMTMREIQFWVTHIHILTMSVALVMLVYAFAQRDKGEPTMSWWAVYSVAIAGNTLSYVCVPITRSMLRLNGVNDVSTSLLAALNALHFILAAMRSLTLTFIIIAIQDEPIEISFEIMCLPGEVYLLFVFVLKALNAVLRARAKHSHDREAPYVSEDDQAQRLAAQKKSGRTMWIEIAFWMYAVGLLILGVGLTSAAESRKNTYAASFIPFFVLFGSIFLASVFLFVCFSIVIATDVKEADADEGSSRGQDGGEEEGQTRQST